MPNESNFAANTSGARVTGTLRDNLPVIPNVPPMGLQAIGPRVTFNFAGLWDADTSYEYYDVVRDATGASYIARVATVPAGTPLANTDYWVHWSDPNAQYDALYDLVTTFDGRISSAADTANDALAATVVNAGAIEAAEDQIADLNTSVSTLDAKITGISRVSSIENAFTQFNIQLDATDSLQGSTPFSTQDNYEPDNDSLMFACMLGTDEARYLSIKNRLGAEIGRLGMPNGHYGVVTYNKYNGYLYTANYTAGTSTRYTLFEINVNNPAVPSINRQIALDPAYFGAYNFVVDASTIGVGYMTANHTIRLFKFSLENATYTEWCELDVKPYPFSGKLFAHITWDEANKLFIYSGYAPNSMVLFNESGEQVGTVQFSETMNFITVGELEEVTLFNGRYIWFSSRRNDGEFGENTNRMAFFCYDIERGCTSPFTQLATASDLAVIVNYTARNDGRIAFDANNRPIFHFFEDACNYVRSLNERGLRCRIAISGEYPFIAHAWNVWAAIDNSMAGTSGTIPALGIRGGECTTEPGMFRDSENVINASGSSYIFWIFNGNHHIVTPSFTPSIAAHMGYVNNAHIQSRNIINWTLRNTQATANNITNTALSDYTFAICKTQSDNTVTANSAIITG